MKTDIVKLKLLNQECKGSCLFSGPLYITAAFQNKYRNSCYSILQEAITLVQELAVNEGADYLQVFLCNGEKFYLIDDISHTTALLPSDY